MSTTEEERLRSLLFTTADEYKKTCEQRDALQSELRESQQSIESAQSEINRYKLQVEELREQIAWLKRGDILHVLTDQEYIDQCERERLMQVSIDALDRENAELRELCRSMLAHMRRDGCEGCVCKGRCDAGELDECVEVADFARRMRELGIEVD